jgi:hypothetical protein
MSLEVFKRPLLSHAQGEREIVVQTDWDKHVLELTVFAAQGKKRPHKVVGSAHLEMRDLPDVVRLLTERLRGEEQLAKIADAARRRSKKRVRKAA